MFFNKQQRGMYSACEEFFDIKIVYVFYIKVFFCFFREKTYFFCFSVKPYF